MKNHIIIMAILLLVCSCATQQSSKKQIPSADLSIPLVQPPDRPVLVEKTEIKPLYGDLLSDVITSKSSFNPTSREKVGISYKLAKRAKVTVNVYDPDSGLIATNVDKEFRAPGQYTFAWDGKDLHGRTVPDEAYFFTVIAEDANGDKEVYDPITFSGGVEHDIIEAHIDPQQYTINYTMPEMGRVMIRLGIQGGPLMHQLVDWEPRVRGAITEYWNGKDKDNLVELYDYPKFKMLISYFTLPENSVISYGNKAITYRAYKKMISSDTTLKPNRGELNPGQLGHFRLPRTLDYSPILTLSFSNSQGSTDDGLPILNGKTLVQVDLAEEDKNIFQNQQFEICFFLNHEFYAEDETGYTPFNWVWDLSSVSEGEHLLTVNVTSFKDQIGVLSRRVKVVK